MEKANIKETLNGNNNEKYITPYLLHKKLSDYTPGGGGGGSTNKFDSIPVGAQLPFAGTTIPSGYLLCDGRAVSRTTYKDLFEVIGTTYGAGDGSTTFNLPDKRGRVSVGLDSNDSDFNIIGKTGGEKKHQLKIEEMPSHNHNILKPRWRTSAGANAVYGSNGLGAGSDYDNMGYNGGGQPHNNLQPYEVDNWIIKASKTTSTPTKSEVTNTYSESENNVYSCNYINSHNLKSSIIHSVTPINSTNYDDGWGGSYYYKTGSRVYLHVAITISQKQQTNITTLPIGYRPRTKIVNTCSGGDLGVFGTLQVNPDGKVYCYSNGIYLFGDISFDTFEDNV